MKPIWLCRLFGHKFKLNYADVARPTDFCTRCGFRPSDVETTDTPREEAE